MKLIPDAMAQTAEPAPDGAPTPAPGAAPAPAAPTPPTPPLPTPPVSSAPAAPTPPVGTQTGTAANGAPEPGEQPSAPDLFAQIVPILVVMGIIWALVIRPRARKEKEQLAQLRNPRRGDVVVTNSGFVVRVTRSLDDAEVEVELAPNVRVRLLRTAIAEVRSRGEPVKDEPAPAKAAETKTAPAPANDAKPGGRQGGGKAGGKGGGRPNQKNGPQG
jgi:preprotein translocase subunit YajC